MVEAKHQLSIAVDDDSHDPRLLDLIQAAGDLVEQDCNISLLQATFIQSDPYTSNCYNLLRQNVVSITSVELKVPGEAPVALDPADFELDVFSGTVRLLEAPGTADSTQDRLITTYVAGGSDTPPLAKAAIRLLVGFWFENVDMLMPDSQTSMLAYERVKTRLMRSRYP